MPDVLFICTGNLCRSPSAELFLDQHIQRSGPAGLTVGSAGIWGASDDVPERLRQEAVAFGLDFAEHRPHRMRPEDIAQSQLVIGMARQHVREVVLLDRSSFPRAFTLREAVRRGMVVGSRQPEESMEDWLLKVHGARRHLDLIGDSGPDDIPDPIGGPRDGYRRMLTEVEALISDLYTLIWGSPGT